ncbi:MAG TPA: cytochrome c [Patescibacteria group bacterium]|nr:cytochrome c [Patescibacteria group bacterium]
MGRFLLGVVVGILLVAGGAFFYFTTGMAPAAATAAPMPFEKFFAGADLHARIRREAPKAAPPQIPATPENLLAGAMIYKKNCAFCHGLPNSKSSEEGHGMYPHAPQLFTPRGMVTDDPPGITYWKVRNGIRLTGMPSFGASLTYQQMWKVSLLLRKADKLPPKVSAALAPTPAAGSAEQAGPMASPKSTRSDP